MSAELATRSDMSRELRNQGSYRHQSYLLGCYAQAWGIIGTYKHQDATAYSEASFWLPSARNLWRKSYLKHSAEHWKWLRPPICLRNKGIKEAAATKVIFRGATRRLYKNERMKEWRNEGMKEWRNEGMKEWKNEIYHHTANAQHIAKRQNSAECWVLSYELSYALPI